MKQFIFLIVFGMISKPGSGQMIVHTEPENRKALIEEFGGFYCSYCPAAYEQIEDLQYDFPGLVKAINIHTGFFANPLEGDPDLRTEWGHALDVLSGNGQAYPAATVNRHVFPGLELFDPGTTALGLSHWASATSQILEMPAPVNVALQADFDAATSVLTVYAELYYTADSDLPDNFLHIALLQNDLTAPQVLSDGSTDPSFSHHRVLREFLTGQWGAIIESTTSGYFESRTFTYALPAHYRGVPVNPSQLEVVAFITQDQQEVLNVASTVVDIHLPGYTYDVNIWEIHLDPKACENELLPAVYIRNDGSAALTGLLMSYSVNEGPVEEFVWNGALATLETALIELPGILFEGDDGLINTFELSVSMPGSQADENSINNAIIANFSDPPNTGSQEIILELKTDQYGYEVYWELLDPWGDMVTSGGNQNVGASGGGQQTATPADPGAYGNGVLITEHIPLNWEGCYQFRILDDFSDGICCDYGAGFFRIKDQNGNILFSGGAFGAELTQKFNQAAALTALTRRAGPSLSLFPNPTSGQLSVELNNFPEGKLDITLFNTYGRTIQSYQENCPAGPQRLIRLDVSRLDAGMYFLQLQTGNHRMNRRFVVDR